MDLRERHSVLEAQVFQEGSTCLGLDGAPFTLRGELRTRPDRNGGRHLFFHSPRLCPLNDRNVANDLGLRDEDELVMVNGVHISHWDHSILLACLAKLPLTDNQELVFVVRRLEKGDSARYVFMKLSLSFEIFVEKGLSDHVVKVVHVALKITELITPVDIINIIFKEEESVLVKHAAIQSHYLTVQDDKDLDMAPLNTPNREAYCFKKYLFCGQDERNADKSVFLCALQSELTRGFLSAQLHTNEIKLTEAPDEIDTDIHNLTRPDPRLFRVEQANEGLVLRSILYDNYYLYYDVKGFRLKRCNPRPQDPANLRSDSRNFVFDFAKKPMLPS